MEFKKYDKEVKERDFIENWCINRYEYFMKEPESYMLELELCYFNQISEIPLMPYYDFLKLMEIFKLRRDRNNGTS
jgi:hypothetical protein